MYALGGCASYERFSPDVEPVASEALHSVRGLVAYLEASGIEVKDYHVREYNVGIAPITDLIDSTAVLSFEYDIEYYNQIISPSPSSYSHFPLCYVRAFESESVRQGESWRYRGGGETYTRRTPSILAGDFVTVRRRYGPPPVQFSTISGRMSMVVRV